MRALSANRKVAAVTESAIGTDFDEPPKPEAKPIPKPKPAPEKAKPEKPKPEAKPKAETKPETKPAPKAEKTPAVAKPTPAHQRLGKNFLQDVESNAEKAAPASGKGATPSAKPKSDRLGKDFLKGIAPDAKKDAGPTAAKLSPLQIANIRGMIAAQIAPCYLVNSGGVDISRIRTTLELRLNKDGSLASPPKVTDQTGLTAQNRPYAQQVAEAARRAVLRCSPLHLPADQYQGGWEWISPSFTPSDLGQ